MSNLSPDQFPDHVPANLAIPTALPRMFLDDRPYGGGTEVPQSQINTWRNSGNTMGGHLQVVPSHAPTVEDFGDMGPARQEGRVNPYVGRAGVLTEVGGKPWGAGMDDSPTPINPNIRQTLTPLPQRSLGHQAKLDVDAQIRKLGYDK